MLCDLGSDLVRLESVLKRTNLESKLFCDPQNVKVFV